MSINKAVIQSLIMDGKLKKAAQNFLSLVKENDEDLTNTLILQLSRINKLEKDVNMGMIASPNAQMEQNRITHALLSMLDEIDDDLNLEENSSTATARIPNNQNSESVKKILFLGVNPRGTERLSIDTEVRRIEEGLKLSQQRDKFEFVSKFAVRVNDLRRYLLDESPNIVHFSGHGEGEEGLVFEDENGAMKLVDGDALANLFKLFSNTIECILLNACYSTAQSESIVKYIPNVIGMKNAMPDNAAIEFSVAFYDAIGAGRDYEFAYELGKSAIQMNGIKGEHIPQFLKK